MTAESVEQSRWPMPPMDGYTVDDLFTLPDLPPHTELIDGTLVFVSPQRYFHFTAIDLLVNGLRRSLPPDLKVAREMTVVLDRRNGPEPDISVVKASAKTGPLQTHFKGEDVVLAIEVISPESESRDRYTKPHKYAAAGIRHFWLVEMAGPDCHPVVQVYELGQTSGTYALTGIHHDHIKVDVPCPIDIDLTAIEEL
ncbi:Uma2 family endonuclease [Streptomyces sp. PSKA54]|uniref:Uma2 family endonuclease n=1 Tax=Streptomyces himalayensis subsp. aureolus TaxID=2758039 RepID=A0A7W2D5V9_9ACTN|nr:Uma2 family endonuclease [Streptomyces himalayensis]MBA4865338.1 Uma2 family endonuclease [Streptomyces himalayensis subsp. aureolus]